MSSHLANSIACKHDRYRHAVLTFSDCDTMQTATKTEITEYRDGHRRSGEAVWSH